MTTRSAILIWALLFTGTAFSQTPDYSQWLTNINIAGKTVFVLRVPQGELNPKIQSDVYNIQWQLDHNRQLFQTGRKVEFGLKGQVETSCRNILKQDSLFPLQYYREEAIAYTTWDQDHQQQLVGANLALVKRQEDSLQLIKLKEGYNWINTDTVWVRVKTDGSPGAIGRLYRLSYVRAYEVVEKPGWVQVRFGDHSGYILKHDLAQRWEDMQLADEELQELKSGRYFSFDPTATYQAVMDRAAADKIKLETANAIPGRKLIRGPKGGCYYIDSQGNRQYVDRSFCK